MTVFIIVEDWVVLIFIFKFVGIFDIPPPHNITVRFTFVKPQ